jgi:hypothetical protein
MNDGVGLFARIDAHPQIVEGILDRLGPPTRYQTRAGQDQTTHAVTLRAFDQNASRQNEGMHFRHTAQRQSGRRLAERRPSGPNVVDEKHSAQAAQLPRRESASDVPLPFAVRKLGLARGVPQPTKPGQQRNDIERFRDTARQESRLVIATLPTPSHRCAWHAIAEPSGAPRSLRPSYLNR